MSREYNEMYSVCWYNNFWYLFQLWDMLPLRNWYTLNKLMLV